MKQTLANSWIVKNTGKLGFTLVELLVAVVVLTIVVGIAISSLYTAKTKSTAAGENAQRKVLMDGILRAKLNGDTNAILVGSDVVALAQYLHVQGYIR